MMLLTAGGGWPSRFVTCWRNQVGSPGCEAFAGLESSSAAWGLHRSFPTRWHQRFFSVTYEVIDLVQRGCTKSSFPPKPVAVGMGLGISNGLQHRGLSLP